MLLRSIALCVFALSAAISLTTLPALGADEPAPLPANAVTGSTSAPANSGALEEITVTAQRVETNLERTPVSVTVLSGAALSERAIVTESDLQNAVPGLTVRGSQNSNQLNYVIRGQTLDPDSGSQPAVLPYVNEVQFNNGQVASAFYDLESIQVLKGPQGTLFGRNSTGGAVLFTTTKPSDEFGGYLTVRGGNYSMESVEGALNLPIVTDKVLLRIAGYQQYREGFQYNTVDGDHVGEIQRAAGRISLVLKPTDVLTNTTVFDYYHSGGSSTSPVAYSAAPPFRTSALIPGTGYFSPLLDSAIGVPGAWAAYLAAHPGTYPGGLYAFTAIQNARGPYTISVGNNDDANRAESSSLSNVTTYDIGSDTQLKNIFGYSHALTRDFFDISGSPYLVDGSGPTGMRTITTQYSDELQLLGKTLADKLTYVAGFYYSNTKYYNNDSLSYVNLEPVIPPSNAVTIGQTGSRSYAGYAQGTYDLGELVNGLGVTAGLRYTSDRESIEQFPSGDAAINAPAYTPGGPNAQSSKTDKPSYQVGVQDQLNPNTFLYVVSRYSFRSAGFNLNSPAKPGTAATGGDGFLPETARDVEVGAKFQGLLGTLPTRLNIAGYNQWVDNVQRSIFLILPAPAPPDSGVGLTVNIPKARVQGVEVEAEIDPLSWLKFGVNGAYTSAAFTDNVGRVFNVTQYFGPYSDTPRWSGSVYGEVSAPLPHDVGTFSLRGDLYTQSTFYFGTENSTIGPGTQLPSYTLANFRIGLENIENSRWSVAAYVHNAFNRVYFVGGNATYSSLTINSALPGDPRTFWGEVNYKF
jgi:iron complex outermembrane recepter protein